MKQISFDENFNKKQQLYKRTGAPLLNWIDDNIQRAHYLIRTDKSEHDYNNDQHKKNILEAINIIAPEHLELCTNMNQEIIKGVKNAGSIFIGKFSPEAIGDYMAGPNHVLPTSGSARFSSGLSVNDFLKRHSLIKITKTGIERLGSSVINLAEHENLDGHANSVKMRLKKEN